MSVSEHAKNEFALLIAQMEADPTLTARDIEMQKKMHADVTEVMELMEKQGHSGFSIGMFFRILKKLSLCEPLTPITGDSSEWMEVGDDTWQNKRCPALFKSTEKAYHLDSHTRVDPDGWTTSAGHLFPVEFPFTPAARKYVANHEILNAKCFQDFEPEDHVFDTEAEVYELYKTHGISVKKDESE